MARVSDNLLGSGVTLGLTLDRYQELLRLPEASFNGLLKDTDIRRYDCTDIWKQTDRDYVANYIAEAEEMREQELVYPPSPRLILNEMHRFGNPLVLDKKYIVALGTETTSTIEAGVALDHGVETAPNDPVTITVTTTVTDATEIAVFYPGESVRILPSNISISGGVATISLPRSRLVDPTLNDDREDPLSYFENDNFLETVDVKRVYMDATSGVVFVWTSMDLVAAGALTYPDGSEATQQALGSISNYRLSVVSVYPGSGGSGANYTYCIDPTFVRVSYKAGRRSSQRTEIQTLRFAHTLMPYRPQSAEAVQQYWVADNEAHPSKITSPYGWKSGAVEAWIADSRAKIGGGGMLR